MTKSLFLIENGFIFAPVFIKKDSKMKRFYFDTFSRQALSELHRFRAVMFSPTARLF